MIIILPADPITYFATTVYIVMDLTYPVTVANFVSMVRIGRYTPTLFSNYFNENEICVTAPSQFTKENWERVSNHAQDSPRITVVPLVKLEPDTVKLWRKKSTITEASWLSFPAKRMESLAIPN